MTFTTSANQEINWQKLGSEFNLLADVVTVTKSDSQQICWQILAKGKSAGRFSNCHYICQSGSLLKEIGCWGRSVGGISDCFPICQSGNLLAEIGEG